MAHRSNNIRLKLACTTNGRIVSLYNIPQSTRVKVLLDYMKQVLHIDGSLYFGEKQVNSQQTLQELTKEGEIILELTVKVRNYIRILGLLHDVSIVLPNKQRKILKLPDDMSVELLKFVIQTELGIEDFVLYKTVDMRWEKDNYPTCVCNKTEVEGLLIISPCNYDQDEGKLLQNISSPSSSIPKPFFSPFGSDSPPQNRDKVIIGEDAVSTQYYATALPQLVKESKYPGRSTKLFPQLPDSDHSTSPYTGFQKQLVYTHPTKLPQIRTRGCTTALRPPEDSKLLPPILNAKTQRSPPQRLNKSKKISYLTLTKKD